MPETFRSCSVPERHVKLTAAPIPEFSNTWILVTAVALGVAMPLTRHVGQRRHTIDPQRPTAVLVPRRIGFLLSPLDAEDLVEASPAKDPL